MFRAGTIRVGTIPKTAHPHIQIRWTAQIMRRRGQTHEKPNTLSIEDTFATKVEANLISYSKTSRPTRRVEARRNSNPLPGVDGLGTKCRPASSRKRIKKSKGSPPQRSADTILYDVAYLKHNFELPTASQYDVSYGLAEEFPRLLQSSGLDFRRNHGELPKNVSRGNSRSWSTLHIVLEDGSSLDAKGHGSSMKKAQQAADLHALCQLHRLGNLRNFLELSTRYMDPGHEKLLREADAKKDIINYAARHDCLPKFSFHRLRSLDQHVSPGRANRNRKQKAVYRAHASIPKLGFNGYGRAGNCSNAILAASISLKHAAEARHAAMGDGTLLIKDYTNLNLDSGEKFVYFYCNHQRLQCDTALNETKENETGGIWNMQITLKSPEVHQAQNDLAILKRTWKPGYDIDAWPGVLRGGEDLVRTFEGISMKSREDAEAVGYLTAAIELKRESSTLWEKFVKEMRRGNGDILKPVSPIELEVGSATMEIVKHTLQETGAATKETAPTITELDHSMDQVLERSRQLSENDLQRKNESLRRRLDLYETHPSLTEIRRLKLELPMNQFGNQVLKMVHQNDVCVVIGATGSGKTTQVPQLILDDLIRAGKGASCNILCTQPRRIAAVSVAQRVSVERNEGLGESVGYSVRFNAKPPEFGGSIHYLTTGILLKQIQQNKEGTFEGISHIIVDEVHERDLNNDFLLVVLKTFMEDRKAAGKPAIKIILMSATIDTSLFCKYFGDVYPNKMCPFIEVPGRTFPVTTHFLDEIYPELRRTYSRDEAMGLYSRQSEAYRSRELEGPSAVFSRTGRNEDFEDEGFNDNIATINWKSKGITDEDGDINVAINKEDTLTPIDLMGITIAHILRTTTEGSILVFLPGLPEIMAVEKQLKNNKPLGIDFGNNPLYRLYLLHSSLPNMQQEVFAKVGPGQRKIILATNIAETSVTIPDVVYVVDSSKQRELQYDKTRRISTLVSTWTAKSNAQQRAGRAGRVQHGHYYTMASRARYESFEVASKAEILRTDLQTLCLQVKKMEVDNIWNFLSRAIEPPSRGAVETSIDELQALGALDHDENLTPLGRYLSALPLAPSIGKMVLLGAIFRCLDPILILAAVSSAKNPFLSPPGNRDEAERCKAKWAMGTGSDQAAIVHAFQEWRRLKRTARGSWQPERQFAWENFLHHETLCNIARIADQLMDILQASGLVEPPLQNIKGISSRYGTEYENAYSDSQALQVALLTAGFYPNIAIRKKGHPRFLRTVHENEAAINPYSLAAPRPEDGKRYGRITTRTAAPPGTLFTFAEKTQGDDNGIFLRDVTRTFPLAVYLFGGKTSMQGSVITVDDWIPFYAKGIHVALQRLHNTLQDFLKRTFDRLGIARSSRTATQPFLEQDKARDPLVKGIVYALESCAPKGLLDPRSAKDRPSPYGDSKERDRKSNIEGFHSSSRSERSTYSSANGMPPIEDRNFFGRAQYKPHQVGNRPPGFYSDGAMGRAKGVEQASKVRPKSQGKGTLLDLLNRWQK